MSNKLDIDPSSGKGNMEVDPSTSSGVLYLQGTTIEAPILTLTTDEFSGTFDPQITASGGTLRWDLGDGSIVEANGVSHTYSQEGDKTVKVYLNTVPSIGNITNLNIFGDSIKGTVDLEDFTAVNNVNFSSNSGITDVVWPVGNDNNISVNFSSCSLSGEIDVSGLFLTDLLLTSNTGLTSVIFPDPSQNLTLNLFNCDITGTLDVSSFNFEGQLQLAANQNLTTLILPETNTGVVSAFYAYTCTSLSGEIDLRGWDYPGATINIGSCPNITALKLPSSSQTFNSLSIYGTGISSIDASGLTFNSNGVSVSAQGANSLSEIIWPDGSIRLTSFNISTCNFSGVLDFSDIELSRPGYNFGTFYVDNNSITQILHKDSSGPIYTYTAYDCSLVGTLDVSGLTGIYDIFRAFDNTELSEILLPEFSNFWSVFDVNDCSLSQTTVDDIFSKMNTYFTSNSPTEALTINTSGGTNAVPTDSSQNSDILSLESIFSGAGQTLTITINE